MYTLLSFGNVLWFDVDLVRIFCTLCCVRSHSRNLVLQFPILLFVLLLPFGHIAGWQMSIIPYISYEIHVYFVRTATCLNYFHHHHLPHSFVLSCLPNFLVIVHLRNACFVFDHIINISLAFQILRMIAGSIISHKAPAPTFLTFLFFCCCHIVVVGCYFSWIYLHFVWLFFASSFSFASNSVNGDGMQFRFAEYVYSIPKIRSLFYVVSSPIIPYLKLTHTIRNRNFQFKWKAM